MFGKKKFKMSKKLYSTFNPNSKESAFLISALSEDNPFMSIENFLGWFIERQHSQQYVVNSIPFNQMGKWGFDSSTGNIVHESGKFFSIEGLRITTNFGFVSQWDQPIINQPEIGILGILTKKFNGVLHFLMQAKMEPGNINFLQLAPTVQATRSNYTKVHQGKDTKYLEYFTNLENVTVLIDQLQSEQGARFFSKRNRNMIVEVSEEIVLEDGFCWLTLGQIKKLLKKDNLVNMDARSVLSCIPFVDMTLSNYCSSFSVDKLKKLLKNKTAKFSTYNPEFLISALDVQDSLHNEDKIISWFTNLKTKYELSIERIPLKEVQRWQFGEAEIFHEEHKYFSVIAVSVEAQEREITKWTQPMIRQHQEGLIGFITREINGDLHFLVQAKLEPGNFDILELAPTVQCITGSYKLAKPEFRPPFLKDILTTTHENILFSANQSEEGGRFYREQNKNIIVKVDDSFALEVPENFIWMTLKQMNNFIKYNNYFNVEARSLIACLSFI